MWLGQSSMGVHGIRRCISSGDQKRKARVSKVVKGMVMTVGFSGGCKDTGALLQRVLRTSAVHGVRSRQINASVSMVMTRCMTSKSQWWAIIGLASSSRIAGTFTNTKNSSNMMLMKSSMWKRNVTTYCAQGLSSSSRLDNEHGQAGTRSVLKEHGRLYSKYSPLKTKNAEHKGASSRKGTSRLENIPRRQNERRRLPKQETKPGIISDVLKSGDSFSNPTGVELIFLGTQSGSPSNKSNVTSQCLRVHGRTWLFDCGEGTQHQMMKFNVKQASVDCIFITHLHGDHIFGLPGLILDIAYAKVDKIGAEIEHFKAEDDTFKRCDQSLWRFKQAPLQIFGPPGIARFIATSLEISRTCTPIDIVITELDLAYSDTDKIAEANENESTTYHLYGDRGEKYIEEPVSIDTHHSLRRVFVRSLQAQKPKSHRYSKREEHMKNSSILDTFGDYSLQTDTVIRPILTKFGKIIGLENLRMRESLLASLWPRFPTLPPAVRWELPVRVPIPSTLSTGTRFVTVEAAPILHKVPCVGYVIKEPARPGHIDVKKCEALGLPPSAKYRSLKQGETVFTDSGVEIRPEDVIGPASPGRTLVLLGDTSNPENILKLLPRNKPVDLLVHESTFSDADYKLALRSGHSTSAMAGSFAYKCRAKILALTHFSGRYHHKDLNVSGREAIGLLVDSARNAALYSCDVIAAHDFMRITPPFPDNDEDKSNDDLDADQSRGSPNGEASPMQSRRWGVEFHPNPN